MKRKSVTNKSSKPRKKSKVVAKPPGNDYSFIHVILLCFCWVECIFVVKWFEYSQKRNTVKKRRQ